MGINVSKCIEFLKRLFSSSNEKFLDLGLLIDGDKMGSNRDITFVQGNEDGYFDEQELTVKNIKSDVCLLRVNSIESITPKKIRWKQGEMIGIGSYGQVFLGLNVDTGELIAIKQVPLVGFNISKDQVRILQDEIDLLSKLKHKNIVKYLGTTRTPQSINILLEYVSGGSIASLLKKFGSFSVNVIRNYTFQIIQGLQYLHMNNVIHRDIKGGNILVDKNGICKLTDFGSAKKISALTFNSLHGTTNWMAPEVICQKIYGRYADIWSLGCTLIEMFTGNAPWSEFTNPIAAMYLIAKGKKLPIPKFNLNENMTDDLNDFISTCLKKIPSERCNAFKLMDHPFLNSVQNPKPAVSSEGKFFSYKNSTKIFPISPNINEEDEFFESPERQNQFTNQRNDSKTNLKENVKENTIEVKNNSDQQIESKNYERIRSFFPTLPNFKTKSNDESNPIDIESGDSSKLKKGNTLPIPISPQREEFKRKKNKSNKAFSKKTIEIQCEEKVEIKIEMKKTHKTIFEEYQYDSDEENEEEGFDKDKIGKEF